MSLEDIAEIVYALQRPHLPQLTLEQCIESVQAVLAKKRGPACDPDGSCFRRLCGKKMLPSPLQEIVARDEPLYGVDEILALAITNIYGSVGLDEFRLSGQAKAGRDRPAQQSTQTEGSTPFSMTSSPVSWPAASARLGPPV